MFQSDMTDASYFLHLVYAFNVLYLLKYTGTISSATQAYHLSILFHQEVSTVSNPPVITPTLIPVVSADRTHLFFSKHVGLPTFKHSYFCTNKMLNCSGTFLAFERVLTWQPDMIHTFLCCLWFQGTALVILVDFIRSMFNINVVILLCISR